MNSLVYGIETLLAVKNSRYYTICNSVAKFKLLRSIDQWMATPMVSFPVFAEELNIGAAEQFSLWNIFKNLDDSADTSGIACNFYRILRFFMGDIAHQVNYAVFRDDFYEIRLKAIFGHKLGFDF